jgi:tripartite-type tricarboxylate transporter receptor subunit TctC
MRDSVEGCEHRCTFVVKLTLVLMLICLAPQVGLSRDYPARAVTIIVPFPPGAGGDAQARLIAKGLAERLGKPVVVDNRAGAAGLIGTRLAARAAPDGHTLLYGVLATMVIEPMLRSDAGYDPQRDFVPITLITEAPFVLVVPPSSSVKSVAELLSYARSQAGSLTYASPGPATAPNLLGEKLKALAQAEIIHVPYKGEAPALTDMLGGQLSLMFVSTSSGMSHIRSGKLRPLAVTATRRLAVLPDVPTFAEAGFPGFDLQVWTGLLVPAKTSPEIVTRLRTEIVAVLRSAEFTRTSEALGAVVIAGSPQDFAQRIQSDSASIARLVKALNFKLEE